jgi:hypothetical protein
VRARPRPYSGHGQAAIHDCGSLGDYGPVREEVAGENEPKTTITERIPIKRGRKKK